MNYTNTKRTNLRTRNNQTIRFLAFFAVLFTALLGFALSASAQQPMSVQPTAAELDQFRVDLAQMHQQMDANIAALKRSPAAQMALAKADNDLPDYTPEMKAEAERQLQKMSYEELATVYRAFRTHFPMWREASQNVANLTGKINAASLTKGKHSKQSSGTGTTEAGVSDNCQDAYDANPSWSDWSIAKGIEIAADGVQNVIPPPFNGVATAAYIAAGETALVFETLNNIFDRCSQDKAFADAAAQRDFFFGESYNYATANRDQILNSLGANTTTITNAITSAQTNINNTAGNNTATITTAVTDARTAIINNDNSNATTLNTNLTNAKNTIVNNDNTNTTNIINNDNANKTAIVNHTTAMNDMVMRALIETDLSTESNGVKVGWFMTPTAQGGKLDLVQQIVTQTLASIQAAGGNIGTAQSFLNQANTLKAAGNFKAAYDNYRKAYKAAVN